MAPPLSPHTTMPRSRRQSVAVTPLIVAPNVAAQMLGVSRSHLYELLKRGELVSFADGGARRVLVSSITDYIERKVAARTAATRRVTNRSRRQEVAS
jgi:excisionase family DNA binding protein